MLKKKDLHIHATAYNSYPTIDHTVANVVKQCRQNRLDYVGIIEHLNFNEKHPIHFIEQLVSEFRSLELPDNYFIGVEADLYADGTDSCKMENRRGFGLDYVIGSVHLGPRHISRVEDYIDEEFRRITLALKKNKAVDIIGHPWVQGIRWEREGLIPHWDFGMVPESYQDQVIKLALDNHKAIEVNNLTAIMEQDDNYMKFLDKLLTSRVRVSVGSDAHQMKNIKESISRTEMLEKMGFKDEQIWIPEKEK